MTFGQTNQNLTQCVSRILLQTDHHYRKAGTGATRRRNRVSYQGDQTWLQTETLLQRMAVTKKENKAVQLQAKTLLLKHVLNVVHNGGRNRQRSCRETIDSCVFSTTYHSTLHSIPEKGKCISFKSNWAFHLINKWHSQWHIDSFHLISKWNKRQITFNKSDSSLDLTRNESN